MPIDTKDARTMAEFLHATSSPVKALRLLILGGGAVVSELYLPALDQLGWRDGILVTDTSETALRLISERWPWVKTQRQGFADAIRSPQVRDHFDAVVVALPNSLHFAAVTEAINAGLPVLCEKPLTLKSSECDALGALAKEKKVLLAVGMVRRLSQAATSIQSALQQGLIGDLQKVTVENGGPYAWTSASGAFFKRENGGILTDLGVHHLDWLGNLLGPLIPVAYQDDARGGVEASCDYKLKSSAGIDVQLRLSHLHPLSNTTTFTGTKGSLIMRKDDFAKCEWRSHDGALSGEFKVEGAFSDASWPPNFLTCFAQQFVNFARAVHDGASDYVSANEASRTMGLIEHAYATRREESEPERDPKYMLPRGRAIVTGGTGFVGAALVERLTALGFDDIVVPVRSYQTCAMVARFPVSLPLADLCDRDAVRKLVTGARWVFHLAYGKTDADAAKVTIDGTKILVEEAQRAGVEAIVVLSTAWVYGGSGKEQLINEDAPFDPQGGHYGSTKAIMQKWCLEEASKQSSTRVIVINPACVYGPEGKTYTRLPFEFARVNAFAWVEGGEGNAPYVYIDNLIDAVLHLAKVDAAHGKNFIACDGTTTWRQFITPILGVSPDSLASYSCAELQQMEKSTAVSVRAVLADVIKVPVVRRWIKERWLVQKLRPLIPSKWIRTSKPVQVTQAPAARSQPVPWIRSIFGPSKVTYTSQRLMDSGWAPRVDLQEGQRRSVAWLQSVFSDFPRH